MIGKPRSQHSRASGSAWPQVGTDPAAFHSGCTSSMRIYFLSDTVGRPLEPAARLR